MNVPTFFKDFFKKHRKKQTNKLDPVEDVTCSPSTDNEHLKTISAEKKIKKKIKALSVETDCESAKIAHNDLSNKGVSTSNNKECNINAFSDETEAKEAWSKINIDPGHYSKNLSKETFERIESWMLVLNSNTRSNGTENSLPLKETNINTLSANKRICENAEKELNTICVQQGHDTSKHAPHQKCSAETHNSDNADFYPVFDKRSNIISNLTDDSQCYHGGHLETRLSFERQAFSLDDCCTKEMNLALTDHPRIDNESGIHVEENLIYDICHNQWQLQDVITEMGGFFQKKHSDVRLTIQQKSVDINTTISGSVLLDIPFLRSKLKLQETHIIVAPTVEYHLHGVSHLKLHACLELPHCMGSGNVDKMKVWWCVNVRGNVIKNPIPFRQEIQQNLDIFWMKGTRRNTINVFAKHFCVILCTACEKDVEFDIRALLFHKFGDIDPLTLSLKLHLGGPLSKIKDFEQKIDVRRLAKCGNEHVIYDGVNWYLKRVTVSTNTCFFSTDIEHDADAEGEPIATTTMHAELPVPEDCPERRIIKRLMVGLHGQDISRSRELFETFRIPFHEERATREEYWQRKFGELLRNRGLDNFLSELGLFLSRRGETELFREISTYHDTCTASGLRHDSNLQFIQPLNDISIQAMPNKMEGLQ